MAQLKRSEIIAQAKIDAGRQAENIDLTKEFDFITREISEEADVLAAVDTGSLTADQNYIALPTDFKKIRLLDVGGRYRRRYSNFKVGDDWLRRLGRPQDLYYYDQTEYGTPSIYAIEKSPVISKVYFYPKTETTTPAYEFYYWKFHPKATDDDYLHLYGENYDELVIAGVAWRGARRIKEQKVAGGLYEIYQDKLAELAKAVHFSPGARVQYYNF